MSQGVILFLNGRLTGGRGIRSLVMNKTAGAGAGTNFWACTENSQNNAWNVNFGSGNTNNNNKYNDLYARPLAALEENYIIEWIEAFDDCCRHKKSTYQCTLYRLRAVDLITLAWEVLHGLYKPGTSITFIVIYPKLHEIFAAAFRDRIVQHWCTIRIEPLLEARFQSQNNVSYNCRKGFGTLAAVSRLHGIVERVSENYTTVAYIGRYDIHSFFMSIDVRILWTLLEPFIRENYHGPDVEMLLYLLKITIFHRPQENCRKQGNKDLWNYLAHSKSLFWSKPFIGMPIGNITSQLLANFYLSFFDAFMLDLCRQYGVEFIRFVDDFTLVSRDKKAIKILSRQAGEYLKEHLHLILHPDKVYMQECRHGVLFVGTYIKPGRMYLSNRTWGKFDEALAKLETLCSVILKRGRSEELLTLLEVGVSGINSYLGFACHNNSYSVLFRYFTKLSSFWKVCYVTGHFHTVKINKKYQLSIYLYDTYLQQRASEPQGGRAQRQSRDAHNAPEFRHSGGKRLRAGKVLLPSGGAVPFPAAQGRHHLGSHQVQV